MTLTRLMPLMLACLWIGCAGSGRLRYDTPQEAYVKGMELYDNEKYVRAIEYFQGVFDFGRTHEWADDAQLMLARAYRANEEYLLAANEFTRFIQIYRSDLRVPEAEYERAMTYFDRSPAYFLDQTDTEQAIDQFNLFISRYPTHDLVSEAEQIILQLREKLAQKGVEAARQYERRELFEAAALSYVSVFDRFPSTGWADDALFGAIRAFTSFADQSVEGKQRERLQMAIDNYDRLIQLFPNSPLLKDAETLYDDIQDRLNRMDEAVGSR